MVFPDWGKGNGTVYRIDNVQLVPLAPPTLPLYTDAVAGDWSLWDCCGGATIVELADSDSSHGIVAQFSFGEAPTVAGFLLPAAIDASEFAGGTLEFDFYLASAPLDPSAEFRLKIEGADGSAFVEVLLSASQQGEAPVVGQWQHFSFDLDSLADAGSWNLSTLKIVMVFPDWGKGNGTVYRIDNVQLVGVIGSEPPPPPGPLPDPVPIPVPPTITPVDASDPSTYNITSVGAGNIADGINPDGYGCVFDFGNWVYNAGVVQPGVSSCDPIGTPTPIYPQVIGAAAELPTPTHKWWGSIPFHGEMKIGDPNNAAYITPDPIIARINNKGVRVMGIPSGLAPTSNGFLYQVPDPFSEVFDGVAIGNTLFSNLNAYLKDHSDGSVTVQWQDGVYPVMEATFVHGSPYVYFKAHQGELVIRTKATDGPEKGTYYAQGNSLGVWTAVAGIRNNFLITGEGTTEFSDIGGNQIIVSNEARELTLALLPVSGTSTPSAVDAAYFAAFARSVVTRVNIDYDVDPSNNAVTVTHAYLDGDGAAVETLAGMHPLHWKNSSQATTGYSVRSARGTVKFSQTSGFNYQLPSVGVLPYMPTSVATLDQTYLQNLVAEFMAQDVAMWNTRTDTYWAGKNYGKVAELAAIARSIGMLSEADILIDWLKAELEDWFSADTNGSLDTTKYFVYDANWNTLLGLEESFGAHQQLNDHHFHYGYFVRAAAEICRVDAAWCSDDQYGPMVELLIRDFAGDKDDPMFPYLRNFDPANGFSWASGNANFVLGNNNESTSEAANAYGAIILYGLITGEQALVEKGMYLHASTTASYWEYWNNIDRYLGLPAEYDNFPASYNKLTTSIIWGTGAVFSTWFSGANAHILGIQGLPSNPLNLHIGQYSDYMQDYVALGLAESLNGKPSGLIDDQWRDIWWNLWAMTDADAALADYQTIGSAYDPEAGETKAHTYQWLQTFRALGHIKTGTGALTSDYPAAVAFEKDGVTHYVAYNFGDQARLVSFSDGHSFMAVANDITVSTSAE
ncbi:glucan 1,3-beta-glucanase [Pseudomaricurvus alcaniphilus]|nr:glucan 1,3-beta-glucanase [Pseudomaricurvus alcaniphilus]